MSVVLHTFDDGTVNAIDDARFYRYLTGGQSGVAEGVRITSAGGLTLHITGGWGVILGRLFTVEAQDIEVTPSVSGTQKGRLILQIDMSDSDRPARIISQAARSLPQLVQEDINGDGLIYQLPLAEYSVTEVALSELKNTTPVLQSTAISTYTQDGSALSGSGANGKFKATAGGTYTAFTIDGQSYAVQSGGEKEIELTEGVWYTFVLDTEDRTINFNMGGAVSVPDGKTAMPTNDKDIWLKCASLKSDKTIEEIVNDAQLCAALMSTQNSVEYMMRSTNIQQYVLNSEIAISALDASLPFTTPEMTSNTEPFGEVTTNTTANQSTPGAWGCFNTELTGYYITDGDDKYLQWKWDRPIWAYKFRIKDIYGNNSKVHLQAVLEDGGIADISDSVSVPKDTLVYQNSKPHITKAVGFRIYIDQSSLGANNWVDYGAIKVWGKYYE